MQYTGRSKENVIETMLLERCSIWKKKASGLDLLQLVMQNVLEGWKNGGHGCGMEGALSTTLTHGNSLYVVDLVLD